jgi:alkyl sulfatase BDS1-like metallo-beta-lactamase superfamily hydrolase
MADLLELSSRMIDEGDRLPGATGAGGFGSANRVNLELSEVADGIAVVESFSHVVAFDSGDGLVLFDASLGPFGPAVVDALLGWRTDRVDTLVYTHGHVDHVGGASAVMADADGRGHSRPSVVAHAAVPARFDRYDLTNGYNAVINQRQFAGTGLVGGSGGGDAPRAFPRRWVRPTVTYTDLLQLRVGELELELHHSRGETDDHTWTWIPSRRAACIGDLMVWVFPNAGNPQKVQRYPLEWARALREIAAHEPELLLPAHGLPIGGRARIHMVLDDVATALEVVVHQTLDLMNEGATLDEIVHSVEVPAALLAKPYLAPTYDEPEFVVRNVWRMYGGWYDGNPSRLKPPSDAAIGAELADLAGGPDALARRAQARADAGDLRMACYLVELAAHAAPDDPAVHGVRAELYRLRRDEELSLMAKGIYGWAARESEAKS